MDQHNEFSKIVKDRKEASEQRYQEESKKRLKSSANKHIKTTMIGAIAAVEKEFGSYFGYDENGQDKNEPLSAEEQQMRDVFLAFRAQVLNLGNQQINNINDEIDQYDVRWKRYQLTLPVEN